jgi:hypothetical protein
MNGVCQQTGKRQYRSKREARLGMRRIPMKLRVYLCEHCSFWHYTESGGSLQEQSTKGEKMSELNNLPDNYDRLLGALHGLPDIASTKPSTVQAVTPITGISQTFIVQTYRQREVGDTIFLQCVSREGTVRIAVPPQVSDAIARQRDILTGKTRSKAAKAVAEARKERGELPGFMRKRKS